MFEVERQAYLKALGVVQYVSQQPIAGAMESPVLTDEQLYPPHYFEEDIEDQAPEAENAYFDGLRDQTTESQTAAQSQPSVPTAVPVRQAEPPSLEEPRRNQEPISTEGLTVNIPQELLSDELPKTKASTAQQPSSLFELEFCFAWVETKRGVSLLLDLSDAGMKDLSADEYRLMGDIYKALQIPAEECRYQFFKWPLVNNPKIKQGEAEARETLLGYLEGKVSNNPASTLIVMGDVPGKVLGLQSQHVSLAGQQMMTVQVPSMKAMMSNWENKSQAWRMLAPLRGRSF